MNPLHRFLIVGGVGTFLLLAPPTRADSCETAPLFDLGGPSCSANRQHKECGCSECLIWDAAAGASWYEIRRCDSSGDNCMIVGDTRSRTHAAFVAPSGVTYPAVRPTIWCAAWDGPFPDSGVTYDYSVRSCADGNSGPVCSNSFSNAVGYATAPYMCIDNGLEVSCKAMTRSRSVYANDIDDDGLTSAVDPDDDGDGIPDSRDNCPEIVNIGQRDADRDGVGDVCDRWPRITGTDPADVDEDGIGDRVDDCPWVYNPAQEDIDHDRTGDACDNCPNDANEAQTDADGDEEGDRCDLDDGPIYTAWQTRTKLIWAKEVGYTTWCVYRGDMAELRRSGTYTQAPGANSAAARFCNLTSASLGDTMTPAGGHTTFYLVSGRPGSFQNDLGFDSAGKLRPNANPCP